MVGYSAKMDAQSLVSNIMNLFVKNYIVQLMFFGEYSRYVFNLRIWTKEKFYHYLKDLKKFSNDFVMKAS